MARKFAHATSLAASGLSSRADDAPATRPQHGRHRRWARAGAAASIPIVDDAHEIVGWTETAPAVENGRLRHAGAERVLRGPIFCTQIALARAQDILRAGGPMGWTGPWRCLALCPIDNARGFAQPRAADAPDGAAGVTPAPHRHQ